MGNIKRKSIVIITVLMIIDMLLSLNTTPLYADDTLSGTYNSSQTITVDTTGKYYFKLAGEQGGSTTNFSGGKGGIVGFEMALNTGDILTLEVDSGAGTGTLTNGGGQSALYLNDVLVAVAGGGGGATETRA